MTLELGKEKERGVFRDMWRGLRSRKHLINVVLAVAAIAVEVYYSLCEGSCSYLKGDLFGIPLQYIGIAYMAGIALLSIVRWDRMILLLLSAGVGIELYLVGFQIWHNTYCAYCLAFGAIVLLLFLLNIDRGGTRLSLISMAVALILFSIFFRGSATPSYADELIVPVFGVGKINVRLYTDYFCPPCRAMEPDAEPLIAELIKKKRISITFIDTPFYRHSALYARYFLYAVNEKKEIEHIFAARSALIEAAKQNIGEPGKIETFLNQKGIKIKPFDPKPVFEFFGKAFKEDGINSTPTIVIERSGSKEKATGGPEILKALKQLNEEKFEKEKQT
jgi:thiol:disulfide interchange protein DsbA